jgi:type II secretory pathway pseudopilin PulG
MKIHFKWLYNLQEQFVLKRCKPAERGSTLIEILVVTFILGISVTAMVSLITMSMARNRLAKERAVATRLAQEGIEWVRAERDRLGFSGLDVLQGGETYCLDSLTKPIEDVTVECGPTAFVPNVDPDYVREMMVSTADGTSVVFEVVVTWQGSQGENMVKLPGEVREWSLQ